MKKSTKLKSGDRVICIEDHGSKNIKKGKFYTVNAVNSTQAVFIGVEGVYSQKLFKVKKKIG